MASLKFHPDEVVKHGRFAGSTGAINPETRGQIVELKDNEYKLVSTSFGYTLEVVSNPGIWEDMVPRNDDRCGIRSMTLCYEGPLVKLWWDLDGSPHLSTTNKLECTNSFWGNKEERFGELFYKYGGAKFIENCGGDKDQLFYKYGGTKFIENCGGYKEMTHHFMIMTRDLAVLSDIRLGDNECVVVYLGTMDRTTGEFLLIPFTHTMFVQDLTKTVPELEVAQNSIMYPPMYDSRAPITTVWAEEMVNHGMLTPFEREIFDPLSEDERMMGVDIRLIKSYFGHPVILRDNYGITKVLPVGHRKKCDIIGNSPNVKLLVYNLMDGCRPKKEITMEYFEKYDFLFVPSISFLADLKFSQTVKRDIIAKYRELGSIGFMDAKNFKNPRCRERNLMLVLLLCLPECKSAAAIEAYELFLEAQQQLIKFVNTNKRKVTEGKYDDVMRNPRAVARLKDLCGRSTGYASQSIDPDDAKRRFDFSIKGLVQNERGNSLYRIDKEISNITEGLSKLAVKVVKPVPCPQ